MERLKTWEYWWNEWIKPIIIAGILALVIRTFIVQPFKIPSSSMFPTLKPGDRIFVSKFAYGAKIPFMDKRIPEFKKPETGDIVVFLSPIEKKKYLVKRLIANGGQTVKISSGRIYVDGEEVLIEPIEKFYYYNRGEFGADDKVIDVPEDSFYVLGDNSANSLDSRYWGFAPYEKLVGKAFVIHWPPNRIKLLKEGS
ncbi:MAG: signal peptidase I [Candidatus Omnitrophica bacterium]|nr:signal peptidase I [Candidatus Omnitrophota bacterium]